jgi:hypothetical protein
MKIIYFICLNFFISLVLSIDYQIIDIYNDNYKSYLKQLDNDVSKILDGKANKDIYAIQDIVNTTIYTDNYKIKKLDSWVVVRTFKFYNITHMYHFQYIINENNTLVFQDNRDQFNIIEGWLQEDDAIKIFNLINILKGFLCKTYKKCGEFDLTKNISKNPNQGCWRTSIKMALYGDVRTSLMGCYLTEKDTNLTYHTSIYSEMNSEISLNKTVSFYFMDYSTFEQEVFYISGENLNINNERTSFTDKNIQQLMNDNILNRPPGYKPFNPDEPNGPNTEGLGGFTIFLIILACAIFVGVVGFFGTKFWRKKSNTEIDNSFQKI